MDKIVRRIGILTSGGDAPGMNAAIRAAVRSCLQRGITPIGIHRGYNGLIQGDTVEMNARSVNGLSDRGGTILYTARCKEFTTPEGVAQAVRTCKYAGIDGVIAIGGDGTFRGAQKLSAAGINTVGVPATIDNDILRPEAFLLNALQAPPLDFFTAGGVVALQYTFFRFVQLAKAAKFIDTIFS